MSNGAGQGSGSATLPMAPVKTPTVLKVTVRRPNLEPVFGATVTVNGLTGIKRQALTDLNGFAKLSFTPKEVSAVTGPVPVTAEKSIAGGSAAHGATTQQTSTTVALTLGGETSTEIELVDPCLVDFVTTRDPKTDAILARNMSLQQTIDTLVFLHGQGEIILVPEPVFEHAAGVCKVKAPRADPTVRLRMRSNKVHKLVDYLFVSQFAPDNKSVKLAAGQNLELLQPRNLVGLFRLAKFLLDVGWGVRKIFHAGIRGGEEFPAKGGPGNRHLRGHCVDFSGIEGVIGTGPDVGKTFQLTVPGHWGGAQVPKVDVAAGPPRTATVQTPLATSGSTLWPTGDFATLPFRLDQPVDPAADPRAKAFFLDVYHFFNREYCEAAQAPGTSRAASPDENPGLRNGMVVHPDYPIEDPTGFSGRIRHKDHVHAEMPDELP